MENQLFMTVGGVRYRSIGILGVGGQATVYEAVAEDTDSTRRFAIKRFHDCDEVTEFIESEKLAQLVAEHSHQTVFAAAFVDNRKQAAVSLKLPRGSKTIRQIVQEWDTTLPVSPDPRYPDTGRLLAALDIVKSTLGALAAWHSAGVMHLDISDKNVIWSEAIDRGIAFFLDMSSCKPVGYRPIGGIWSTGGFAAPELSEGEPLTPAADLYSAGALLFYLCLGKRGLFHDELIELPGFDNGNVDYIDKLNLHPGSRQLLKQILILATDRIERHYETAEEMLADIQRLEQTVSNRGISRYLLLNGAADYHDHYFSAVYPCGVDPDLLPGLDANPEGHTIIIDGGGSGKTTLLYDLFRRKLEAASLDIAEPIPIYVPLARFDPGKEGWSTFIADYILQEYCGVSAEPQNRTLLHSVLSSGTFLFELDGINESVAPFLLGEQIEMLTGFPGATVYLASRHSDFDWPCLKRFETVRMLPLSEERIDKILQKRGLNCSGRLADVLRRPMMLSLYTAVETAGEDYQSAGEILLGYHRRLVDMYKNGYHQEADQVFFQTVILNLLPMIAHQLGRLHFTDLDLKQCLDRLMTKEASVRMLLEAKDNPTKAVLDVLISSGLIRRIAAVQTSLLVHYQFTHQFYLEWNIAKNALQEMDRSSLPECLSSCCLSGQILAFLGDLLGEYKALPGASRIESWLQDHLAGVSTNEARMIVRNLVEAMKIARSGKISANFSQLDLSLANFWDCSVTGSDFSEAIVPDAAFLRQGHRKLVNLLHILPDSNRILTASLRENTICIWDMATGQMLQEITCSHSLASLTSLVSLEVSPDQSKLLVHHGWGEVTVIDLDTSGQKHIQLLTQNGRRRLFPENRCIDVGFHDDNSLLCSTAPDGEDQIVLWNLSDDTHTCLLTPAEGYQNSSAPETAAVAYLPGKNRAYAISSDEELVSWNLKRKCPVGKSIWIPGEEIDRLSVSPDGKWMTVWKSTRGEFRLVELATGKMEVIHDNLSGNGVVLTQVTTTNRSVVFGTDQGLRRWDIGERRMNSWKTPAVSALAVDENHDLIAFADIYGTVRIGNLSEGRISHSFGCSHEEETPKPAQIHWLRQSLVKKEREDHILVMSGDAVRKLPMEGCFQSFLDGNHCVWLGVGKDHRDYIHVSALESVSILASAPWDPDCTAADPAGNVIFSERSDLHWAKYYPREEKILVCHSNGLVKVFDLSRQHWRELGNWTAEVAPLVAAGLREEALREALLNISARCKFTENGLMMGTRDGHIQFWNLDGNLAADYAVHDRVKEISPADGARYWLSEGYDGTRCIWDSAARRLMDRSHGRFIADVEEVGDITLYKEGAEGLLFISEIENTGGWRCEKWVAHTSAQLLAVQEADDRIRIYDIKERKLCRIIDLSFTQPDTMWDRLFYSCEIRFAFHESGQWLAVGYPDGIVGIYGTRDNRTRLWKTTAALDVSDAYFDGAELSGKLAEILRQNGSIVKNIDNSK